MRSDACWHNLITAVLLYQMYLKMHSRSLKNQISIHLIFSGAFVLRWVLTTLQVSFRCGLRWFYPVLHIFCVNPVEFRIRMCLHEHELSCSSSTSYPFLLAPSITLSIAFLLDLGVLGLSDSEGADRVSVDFLSVTCDQKYKESINKISIHPTLLHHLTCYLISSDCYGLDNSFTV